MDYLIRRARINDMIEVMRAHRLSIKEICSKDYNPEQIEKWSDVKYTNEIWEDSVNKDIYYVIEVDGRIEGFCHSQVHANNVGEIKGLYFTKVVQGTGLGREVFELSMNNLRADGCKTFFIFATKTAKGFYEKMGFREVESLNIQVRGANLECYKMEMSLF
jgi:putative acetyltransferase